MREGAEYYLKPNLNGRRQSGTAEGRQALNEARDVARVLERWFASADLRALTNGVGRLWPEVAANLDRIKDVFRLVDRVQRAELTRQYELKRTQSKGLGLGM